MNYFVNKRQFKDQGKLLLIPTQSWSSMSSYHINDDILINRRKIIKFLSVSIVLNTHTTNKDTKILCQVKIEGSINNIRSDNFRLIKQNQPRLYANNLWLLEHPCALLGRAVGKTYFFKT